MTTLKPEMTDLGPLPQESPFIGIHSRYSNVTFNNVHDVHSICDYNLIDIPGISMIDSLLYR